MSRGAVVYLVICLPSSLLKLNLSGCRQNLLDEGQSNFKLYYLCVACYRPQRSCEGYVFTPVCLSTGGGGSASVHAGIPPPRTRHPPGPDPPRTRQPPGPDPPRTGHPPPGTSPPPGAGTPPQQMATIADGTHPTGMHSCYK